ncbi:MAG: hypothetical protein ACKPAD_08800 [Bacteroidota bacterium]
MKSIQKALLLSVGIISIAVTSCKDEKEDTCVAGGGGTVDLVLYPQHHGEAIPGIPGYVDSAFIKFNTRDFPGDDASKYDLVLTGDVGSDSVLVQGLKCGDYFLFMTGFDTSIAERVKGGIPYTIQEGASGFKNVLVPVTEN